MVGWVGWWVSGWGGGCRRNNPEVHHYRVNRGWLKKEPSVARSEKESIADLVGGEKLFGSFWNCHLERETEGEKAVWLPAEATDPREESMGASAGLSLKCKKNAKTSKNEKEQNHTLARGRRRFRWQRDHPDAGLLHLIQVSLDFFTCLWFSLVTSDNISLIDWCRTTVDEL